jgi:hypothetical protein
MSFAELLIYAGLYAVLMGLGFTLVRRKQNRDQIEDINMWPANENLEMPKLGSGLGPNRPVLNYTEKTDNANRRAS